ncbi:MAG TPA: DMT family transporter [bacterium]|nr:DMT family transporter [bacterium]
MLTAILASVGYAGGVVVDKIALSVYRAPVRRFIPLLFLFLALITALFVPLFPGFKLAEFTLPYIFAFFLMIVVAISWNVYYYQGIQKENLHEFELIMLLSPLATIIFAGIFLPEERNFSVFVAGLIASIAFAMTRLRQHHLRLSVTAKHTVLAMILMSFESILIKYLLDIFSPFTLYLVRTAVIAAVFIYLYKPRIFDFPSKIVWLTLFSSAFGVLQMVLKFYGFQDLGVMETTIILLLGPFFVYLFSYFYFREKVNAKRDLVCAAVVVACIIYSIFE